MAVIQMPSSGKSGETGMITKWYKKTGDWVSVGDELFTFDTDEGTFSVKSQKAGRLVAIFIPEGEIAYCPADVGMLASPSPGTVLSMGRSQYLDPKMPETPKLPKAPPPVLYEALEEDEEPEEDLAGDLPDMLAADAPAGQPAVLYMPPEMPEESDASGVDEPVLYDLPIAEETLLGAVEDETEDIGLAEDAPASHVQEEPYDPELPYAQTLEYEIPPEEDPQQNEAFYAFAPQDEVCAVPDAAQPETPANAAAQRPAILTIAVDVTECALLLARRDELTYGALSCFAASRAQGCEILGLDGAALTPMQCATFALKSPCICDLSGFGVNSVTPNLPSGVPAMLGVPAPIDAVRSVDGKLTTHPQITLTLVLDTAVHDISTAAQLLSGIRDGMQHCLRLLLD